MAPQWFFPLPETCHCKKWLSTFEANEELENGFIEPIWRGGSRGAHAINSEFAVTGKSLRTPRTATIESEHIYEAYVCRNDEAEKRIEEYGLLTLWSRIKTGKAYTRRAFRPDPFEGRVILIDFDDQRTSGHN